MNDVIISTSALKDIQFPDNNDYKKLGSQILWINKPRLNQPIVIGVFNKDNEFVDVTNYSDTLGRSSSNAVAQIMTDHSKGIIVINCSSTTESGGDIYVVSTNRSKTSKLTVHVSGEISIDTPSIKFVNEKIFSIRIQDSSTDEASTLISYEKGKGLTYKDEYGNEIYTNQDFVQIKPVGVLKIGEGKEPIPLGDTLKTEIEKTNKLLEALINIIKGPAIPEPGNGSPSALQVALNGAITAEQLGNFSDILSKVSNTD